MSQASTSLASTGQAGLQAILIEKIKLLTQTIVKQEGATISLTAQMITLAQRLNSLTVWLLWITAAIGVLTLMQILLALGVIHK